MRYLPLTDNDRQAMLGQIGVGSVDDLFVDVPEAARRDGLVDLPRHQGEMQVERQLSAMAAKIRPLAPCRFSAARVRISTMCRPRWIISFSALSF